ncbi:transcriptional regulator [Pelagibaculum spongiae]|uniref:Transcriptional regulator n=1 Tax=Pelagibaculum spongiae TaxID=2080658 RepID=A0A2V1GZY7_9GAMM|nr:transcriptional regulator [Pelagibaculum spongiae]
MYVAQKKLLQLLKTNGPQTAPALAKQLDVTSMGARGHLQKMQQQGLLETFESKEGVGRPKKLWQLTEQAQKQFPDQHNQLTVDLIISVKELFGDHGLDQLIDHRAQQSHQQYLSALEQRKTIEGKLKALAKIRTDEGYMASVEKADNGWLLIENHCPICDAAKSCQNFCRTELESFQQLFKGIAEVTRQEHLLDENRRCTYHLAEIKITEA